MVWYQIVLMKYIAQYITRALLDPQLVAQLSSHSIETARFVESELELKDRLDIVDFSVSQLITCCKVLQLKQISASRTKIIY
jgi:hypothetical protein